jgi:hypothetical protein
MEERAQLSIINIIFIILIIGLVASYGWAVVFVVIPVWAIVKFIAGTPAMQAWSQRIVTPITDMTVSKKTEIQPLAKPIQSPLVTRKLDPYEHLPFWDRVTKPIDTGSSIQRRGKIDDDDRQVSYLQRALRRLPSYLHYTQIPAPPSKLSIPIGYDPDSQSIVWGDFDADSESQRILHALIAGQTGSGKDAELRLWFTILTMNNTPEEIQFIILDGKADWLSDALAQSAYMAIPPAGGMEIRKENGKRVDKAKERMLESMDWVFDEIERRSILMREAGAINLNAYNEKMMRRNHPILPMLFLIASDVGKSFDGDLGMLVNQLIMKGRAYGIRMIISMQNPVGEGTDWRSQIGLVMSGYQQNPDHDRYIMGIPKVRALVRPSQLPNPEEYDEAKGIFVVRMGSRQFLVKTPHLPEQDWFTYIESKRFVKRWYRRDEQESILTELLTGNTGITRRLIPVAPRIDPRDVLTHDQIVKISQLAVKGHTKTHIMTELGFTSGTTWNAKKEAVESVIIATRGSK